MWLDEQDLAGNLKAFTEIRATLPEQKLLLKLLKMNTSLIPPDFQVERTPTESGYSLSALLPLGLSNSRQSRS